MSAVRQPPPVASEPEPAWAVAHLFPPQGLWDDEDYLLLPTNRLVELADGDVEFPPMPTDSHQDVVAVLFKLFDAFVAARGLGKVQFAPLRMRVRRGKFREPDVMLMTAGHAHRRTNRYWDGADLVVEVVSEDDPDRDWVTKRAEYAMAGIAEYWIADPRDRTLTVFTLDPDATEYREAGRHGEGETARSLLLDGLAIDVTAAFAPR